MGQCLHVLYWEFFDPSFSLFQAFYPVYSWEAKLKTVMLMLLACIGRLILTQVSFEPIG